ncbi:MAG: hypothetical protein UHN02_02715 [Acutalibacteraceae bacterium]|nr:hypothetical protein [Acutalibacteraceae bacterium]
MNLTDALLLGLKWIIVMTIIAVVSYGGTWIYRKYKDKKDKK